MMLVYSNKHDSMTIDEKKEEVQGYCWRTRCQNCCLLGTWEHPYGNKYRCINYKEASEEELDEALLRIAVSEAKADESPIADSGERREFESGAVRDMREGKGRCDLMPLAEVGEWTHSTILKSIEEFKITGLTCWLYTALDDFLHVCNWNIYDAALELSIHFENGAKKYAEDNWKKGIPINSYIDSAVRHYLKHMRGDKDERHDRAFLWNIICLIWTANNIGTVDELPDELGEANDGKV